MCVYEQKKNPKFQTTPAEGSDRLLLTFTPQTYYAFSSSIEQLTCNRLASHPGGGLICQRNGPYQLSMAQEGTHNDHPLLLKRNQMGLRTGMEFGYSVCGGVWWGRVGALGSVIFITNMCFEKALVRWSVCRGRRGLTLFLFDFSQTLLCGPLGFDSN